MYNVYVLLSLKDGCYYIGYTADLEKRYKQHKSGFVRSTKDRRPLKLICFEAYMVKEDAYKREKYLKSSDGKKELKIRLKGALDLMLP